MASDEIEMAEMGVHSAEPHLLRDSKNSRPSVVAEMPSFPERPMFRQRSTSTRSGQNGRSRGEVPPVRPARSASLSPRLFRYNSGSSDTRTERISSFQMVTDTVKRMKTKLPRALRLGGWTYTAQQQQRTSSPTVGGADSLSSPAIDFLSSRSPESFASLHRLEAPASDDSIRTVHFGRDPATEASSFCSNEVHTTKYTWWSFVPVFLWYTFNKTANLYFLAIGIMQAIPSISPTAGVPLQFLPLGIVITLDAVFAAYEDYKRHKADKQLNNALTQRYNRETEAFETASWSDVTVGDVIKVDNREMFPADMVLLAVVPHLDQENSGTCFVETKSLDGETNLKLKEASRATAHLLEKPSDFGMLRAEVRCDKPNTDVNSFNGALFAEYGNSADPIGVPLDIKNVLLRGCKLRNTESVYGLVVYTGYDTKIMRSSGDEFPVKLSTIDSLTNKQVLYVVVVLVAICLIGAFLNASYATNNKEAWYVPFDGAKTFQQFCLLFSTLASIVPITLYVSITIVKSLQVYFMESDIMMYHEATDTPMIGRNMLLNDQLGQISFVFSDKTGTLTCNQMEFRKCSVNGVCYGTGTTEIGEAARARERSMEKTLGLNAVELESFPAPYFGKSNSSASDRYLSMTMPPHQPGTSLKHVRFDDDIIYRDFDGANGDVQRIRLHEFMLHLALCNSVLPEEKNGAITFSSSSPDEQALVSAAKFFNYELVHRKPGQVIVRFPDDQCRYFDILEVFEFSSDRKRMSVIVQERDPAAPDTKFPILLLCKGADNVILSRLAPYSDSHLTSRTGRHLESFARSALFDVVPCFLDSVTDMEVRDGLRTLVVAQKEVDEGLWMKFQEKYQAAVKDLNEIERRKLGKLNMIDKLQDEMEKNLLLLGATAIEDRLQDGVPQTIASLSKAGMSVWVLTGDMVETAINIGFACSLLNNGMTRIEVTSSRFPHADAACAHLDEMYHEIVRSKEGSHVQDYALIVDGITLEEMLKEDRRLYLLRLALECKSVLCCRVSPLQKALVVELVKLNCPEAKTLAIGDGANDVPMIQAAHVGVGVSGEEGMQAVNSSDYAIAQFRFLGRLLLVHGRWNYERIAFLVCYTFYKNVVYCIGLFWYTLWFSAFSGTMIYQAFIQQGYNLLYTSLPVIVYAVLEQDVPAEMCMKHPQLYYSGPLNRSFNWTVFWLWMLDGVYESILVIMLPLYGLGYTWNDPQRPIDFNALTGLAWTVLVVVVNVKYCIYTFNWHWPNVASVLLMLFMLYSNQYFIDLVPWIYATESFPFLFGDISFWLITLLVTAFVIIGDFVYHGARRMMFPTYQDLAQEVHKYHLEDNLDAWRAPSLPPPKFDLPDYGSKLQGAAATVTYQGPRREIHRGFAFDEPMELIHQLVQPAMRPLFLKKEDPVISGQRLRDGILASEDPVIFENQRYWPFAGWGSTYPGHLLPPDRKRWSDRFGIKSAMSINTSGLQVDFTMPHTDENGWQYAVDFSLFNHGHFQPSRKPTSLVRRRAWRPADVIANLAQVSSSQADRRNAFGLSTEGGAEISSGDSARVMESMKSIQDAFLQYEQHYGRVRYGGSQGGNSGRKDAALVGATTPPQHSTEEVDEDFGRLLDNVDPGTKAEL